MRVGVIGAGAISDIYLKNMIERFDNLEVMAISSKHMIHAQEKAKKYGLKACTVQELLADPQIELVVNLTPVGAHYQLIKDALMSGKHVYTEKTLTDDIKKAKELLELADAKGLYLGSAPDTFLGAALQTARKAIDDGILGNIHSFAISTNRNNDLLLSMFAFLREPGAGILYDFGVYYITALTSLLGPVARVGGIVSAPYKTHVNILPTSPLYGQVMDTPNESQVSAVIQLRNGITGTLHINAESHWVDQSYFTIYGTKGILTLTDPNYFGGQVKFLPIPSDFEKPSKEVILWNFSAFEENLRGLGVSEMAEAIASGRKNRASKEMAYHVMEVLTGILNGGEKGAFVEIHSTMKKPEPLENKKAPIVNVGHASFQMKNDKAMLHFYEEVLGMKKLFTLTYGDFFEQYKKAGNEISDEELKKWKEISDKPWITYMKLADHQFVELFHNNGNPMKHIKNRRENYGYIKVNFEVDSIQDIHDKLVAAGVKIIEDIHPVLDGSLEITVLDPDGNEVQFTQYATGPDAMIPLTEDKRETTSFVKYTTQVAYQVQDAVNMVNFYCRGLGLKKVKTLTYADLYEFMKKNGMDNEEKLLKIKTMGDRPWIDYLEVAPHQYIELFHTDEDKNEIRNLQGYDGYQHICLEVTDIHAAWDACIANGLKPEGNIALGCDGAYQFWLVDPDGNRLELMQYTESAKQLQ